MGNGIFVVFRKETLDNLRDRRTLLLGLVYPLLGPILLGAMISLATAVLTSKPDNPVRLGIQNAEAAPRLIQYLQEHGIEPQALDKDGAKDVRDGRFDTVIVLPTNYGSQLQGEETIAVQILIHPARLGSMVSANRVYALLESFSATLAQERLARHGLNPASAKPLRFDSINVAGDATIIDVFAYMIPPFFIFTIFMGGVYLALDTTSGERERGSLEPLLVNPIPRWGLMGGKFLAGVLFTVLGLIVQLVAFKAAFLIAGDAGVSLAKNLDAVTIALVLITAFPLMMFAVAIQIIVAIGTKSFKEAQTYLGLLPLVPAIPGMVLVFSPVQAQNWMMAVPTFGQTLIFGRLVRGESVEILNIVTATSVTLAASVLLLILAARLYEKESLIFGR